VAVATVDVWHLAPGGREGSARRTGTTEGLEGDWRLAARDGCARRWRQVALGGRAEPLGSDDAEVILQARGAWRCVIPARRSGAKLRLAACDACQTVLVP